LPTQIELRELVHAVYSTAWPKALAEFPPAWIVSVRAGRLGWPGNPW